MPSHRNKLSRRLARWRHGKVWADPVRRVRTLESFAATEEDGGKDLLAAARRILDSDLRQHILRHADDEMRHAALFRGRAAELRSGIDLGSVRGEEPDRAFDVSRGRKGEIDGHGFYSASMCDELGEVAYVAMLHVAENRARDLFEIHHELNRDDPETRRVFEEILRDESYHIAYTRKILDQWRRDGREAEVREALKTASSSRFMGAWKRLGVRAGAGFSQLLLLVLYWTLLLPIGLLSGWSRGRPDFDSDIREHDLTSQY